MAELAGYGGSVQLDAVAKAFKSWSIDLSADTADITDFESPTNWREFLGTLKGWTVSLEGDWQEDMLSLLGTTVAFKCYVDGSHYYSGNAIVTGFGPGANVNDPVSGTLNAQGTGALAYN